MSQIFGRVVIALVLSIENRVKDQQEPPLMNEQR